VAAGQTGSLKARLVIRARDVSQGDRRPPINLALVVDTSGSMEGRAIEDARAASLALLGMLSPGDRLSVVTFGSRTEVLVPSSPLKRRGIAAVRERIGAMRAEGTTDLEGGLQAGLQQVMAHFDQNGINRVVLLSDGVPNEAGNLEGLAAAAGQRGIPVIALGLGIEYDEILLGRIAQLSGGRFHYVEESSRVAGVFRDEVLRLQRVIARDGTLTVVPGPGVAIEAVIGQQTTPNGRGVTLSLGELADGDERELVVQLVTPERHAGSAVELFDAVVTFQDALADGARLEQRIFLGARATSDEQELTSGRNEEVERAAARLQAAVATVEAISLAREGQVEAALRALDEGVALIRGREAGYGGSYGDDFAFQAEAMEDLRDALPQLDRSGHRAAPPAVSEPAPVAAASEGAPSAEEAERRARRAHGQALDALLSQKSVS
jgi:Ca-activated chloride channel family protein